MPEQRTPLILDSWQRCRDFGLDQGDRPDYDPIPGKQLAERREQNSLLVCHARPVMESLYDQIANTESMIVLTDANGLILHSLGDDDFLERAHKVALCPGVSWAENSKGTNAVGTAIANLAATIVHGDEHYLAANQILTCSAVPISNPLGELIGVLDITGDRRSYQRHTIALARMSCQLIENQMFRAAFADALLIEFHSRPEFIGTLCEGIIAAAPDGRLLAANKSALAQLGLGIQGLRTHTALSLLDISASALLDHVRRDHDGHLLLKLNIGIRVFARVRAGAPLRRPLGVGFDDLARETPSSARRAEPLAEPGAGDAAPPHLGALNALCTGDPGVEATLTRIRRVIGRDIPILIQGETGTGKELLARAIHADSPRRERPFVAVNCASIPEGLIESELFGYEEGAFTGARKKGAEGKIRQASGGTLFLDEIGDMPLSLQARMLRVLQERVVTPLGSTRSHPVDVAIICATHRRLKDAIVRGSFREDLYYRLNGQLVSLPPLRERSDLDAVVERILRQQTQGRHLRVDADVLNLFHHHPWPGNIRQLSNLLRTAAAMADDELIRVEHLPEDFLDDLAVSARETATTRAPLSLAAFAAEADTGLDGVALAAIQAMLEKTGGNVSAASRRLGISRNTIYRKLRAAP
ncbi:MAG: sigma-54-dependent Fis family transcriptional regulator [Rhodocyclales bacterium GWA2_65_19]|nr:MAG: sigma-54-dependent Fis family transcriptional regulator [Rhodocyclales bacterium GWA2_65_19]